MGKPANDNLSPLSGVQAVLDALVADGSIVLGEDGNYRTPENHAIWAAQEEEYTASLYAEHLAYWAGVDATTETGENPA